MTLFTLILAASVLTPGSEPRDTTQPPQGVDYRIAARLDEATDVLHARARLQYTNRSPHTLDTLYFHQHLNAFRPNSAWARRELEYGQRRFQDLGPTEHAFERLTTVEVGAQKVSPVYPGAPDSTVVAIPLPTPLRSGDSVTVQLDWDARLSTLPRRQGRKGRHYDWAQWYPRIAVFQNGAWQTQPLLPQGEFFGEFASYDVTLDVAADQVIGATGVPVSGDPGWQAASRTANVSLHRNVYPERAEDALGLLPTTPDSGRKHVRWRAEDVHHFAWSTDPEFIYEGGMHGDVPIHVLYQPSGAADWGAGTVTTRARSALEFMETLFGPYVYPQLTIAHRTEQRGGTEFPMLIMNSGASEGLIVHEVAHEWAHAMLANNEWREGWLDEGLASFVDTWYFEQQGQPSVWDTDLDTIRTRERTGKTQPIALPGAEFTDPVTYSRMTYTKTSLVLRMLRELVGEDTMRQILRTYYDRYKLRHVTEASFREVAEEVSGQDLDWFFQQWFHTTNTLDYGIGNAQTTRLADGRWRTRVQVLRLGQAWMPVTLQVGSTQQRLLGRERSQIAEVVTAERPAEVVLDPGNLLLDIDPTNNRVMTGR
jgi:hypothetical protein